MAEDFFICHFVLRTKQAKYIHIERMSKMAENYFQKEIETMPYEEMKKLQSEKLVKQVKHVYENVEYYRKLMDEKGVKPDDIKSIDDLYKLPFLTKADLRDAYPYGLLAKPLEDCVRIHSTSGTTGRRVVARSGVSGTPARARNTTKRTNNNETYYNNQKKYYSESSERMSSARCLADYTKCMNGYCERANTAYNRCYCSSKLSQIDAKYQNKIDSLITQIMTLKSANQWSDSEMNEYWMDNVGKYYGDNSWTNIDNALSGINWTDLDSRVRGQNAFATGHQYCSQHLTGCYYMATNLRDAYRSEISRDCATYEQYLYTIQSAAESIVESYK